MTYVRGMGEGMFIAALMLISFEVGWWLDEWAHPPEERCACVYNHK